MLRADRYFYIGKTHDICEDFAIADENSTGVYTVICDGCSSSEDTDIGARILAKQAMIEDPINPALCLYSAKNICELLKLNPMCLDATILNITAHNNKWSIYCVGDGTIIKIRNDDTIEITDIEYKSGAPFYLSYKLDLEREKSYIKKYSLERTITKYLFNPVSNPWIPVSNPIVDTNGKPYIEDGYFDDSEDGYHTILTTSDGIHSFQEKIITDTSVVNHQMGIERILPKLLDFKGYNGQFVGRRMRRFMKDSAKWSWSNLDDLSMAGIHYEKD